jgi:hypothetical protein
MYIMYRIHIIHIIYMYTHSFFILCTEFYIAYMQRIPTRVLYMNLETTRLKGSPRNRWQNEVREVGRIVGGEGWQGKVYNREEWKKLLRMARNRRILHMAVE